MNYKAKARAYHTAVSEYDARAVTQMVRDDYIQHNPKVPTGRAAFVGFLPKLKEHQTKIVNMRMLNDGSHVIMHHVWKNALPFGGKEMAAFHIIRFDGDGLIAEHWNVMAPMAPANASGRTLVDGDTEIRDVERTAGNKAVVAGLMTRAIGVGAKAMTEVSPGSFRADFRQHHPAVADGIAGYQAAVAKGALKIQYQKLHKVFGEGNFVLSIAEGVLGGKPTAFYDLFRLEGGVIAEHWSIYQDVPTEGLANDNTMFNF